MIKKTGFTLAEVLVTLGVIGVIAALTIPQLVISTKNEANCSKLAVTVSTLENALHNAIIQEETQGLKDSSVWANVFNIGKYMNVAGVNKEGNVGEITMKSGVKVKLDTSKQGNQNEEVYDNGGTLDEVAGMVTIYTNSADQDPVAGKTAFRFYLGNNGSLYPAGGKDVKVYNDKVSNVIEANDAAQWVAADCNGNNTNYKCTARVIEEGYEMNY